MIYYTGDIHGQPYEVVRFCKRFNPSRNDTIVILGDVGANYCLDERDAELKRTLDTVKPTILCVHGNHEIRPHRIPSYKTREWNGGIVWYEEAYPALLFAKDGEIYDIEGLRHIVIGGAYSVDKYYRLAKGYGWWEDEQPNEDIKHHVEQQLKENDIDVVLSHTCPFKYEPVEEFIPGIDQSTVDDSTERWLDTIEEATDYIAWFCGHWHTNKRIDRMHFLFHQFESSEAIMEMRKVMNLTDEEKRRSIGNYNILVTFATRYALGAITLAPDTMKRIILESLDVIHEQTKFGIIRDIEDYIDQHEILPDLSVWEELKSELLQDIQSRRKGQHIFSDQSVGGKETSMCRKATSDPNDIAWFVFFHDSNRKKVDTFNIFEHGSFREDLKKAARKCSTKEEFAKELRSNLMYYYWSKAEWEVLIIPWVGRYGHEDKKVDVYWQVMNNWEAFLDYVWNNKKKL